MRLLILLLLTSVSVIIQAQTYTTGRIDFSQPGLFTPQQLENGVGIHFGSGGRANSPRLR